MMITLRVEKKKKKKAHRYHCDWNAEPKPVAPPPSEEAKAFKKLLDHHGCYRRLTAVEDDLKRVTAIVKDGTSATYFGKVSGVDCFDGDTCDTWVELTSSTGATQRVNLAMLGVVEQDAYALFKMGKTVRITTRLEVF